MTRKHPRTAALVGILVVALLAAACGDDDDGGATDDTTEAPGGGSGSEASGEPIVVGAIMELSGPGAALGQPEANALELFFDQLNEDGGIDGRPVELRVEDTESQPDRAVELARELIDGGAVALLGPSLAAECNAVRPVAVEEEVVHYCLSGAPFEYGDPYFFAAFEQPLRGLGGVPAAWIESEGYRKVGCLATTDNSGDAYLNSLNAVADDYDLEIVSEKFAAGDTSVETQLTNLEAAGVDVIYSCASGANLVPVVQGVVALGLDIPIFAGSGSASASVGAVIKDDLPESGVFTLGSWVVVPTDEIPDDVPNRDEILAFRDAYEAEFGDPPDNNAAGATDVATILVAALAEAPDGDGLAEALIGTDHEGLLGRYVLTEEDHRGMSSPGVVARFNDEGGFSFVATVETA
ncbi:MAG: ABC transporter substrate-binding protein [Acidimicrobiia bacterium]